jgi:signal transduction histidine kinase
LAVIVFVVLDAGSSMVAQAFGITGLGPDGWLSAAQTLLVVLALAATMYHWTRTALLTVAAVAGLALTVGGTGGEAWVIVVTAVTAVLSGTRAQLVLVVLGQIAYAACLGVRQEQWHPGWGWDAVLTVLAITAVSVVGGLVIRPLLEARDRRRERVHRLEQENAQIRAVERARLADDLQTVVTRGLATIDQHLETAARRPADVETLREGLTRVDGDSRSLLAELRVLLGILRRDVPEHPDVAPLPAGSGRWVERLTGRDVRVAVTVVLGLLATGAAVSSPRSAVDVTVLALGCLACAAAVWRPMLGAGIAVMALVVSAGLGAAGFWDAAATTLLCLVGAQRLGLRRLWLVLVPIAGYGALLATTAPADRVGRVLLVWYAGFLAIVVGLAARHLASARSDSMRRMDDLTSERECVAAEERSAVARELHDVVAHQLSVSTLLVLATSLSDDPDTLTGTLGKVRRATTAAHHELSTLVHTMRSSEAAGAPPAPLASPSASARALVSQLAENGHHPVMDIDPEADDLDVTTQRTLTRIMQEATTNILRYAPEGSLCRYTVAVEDDGVRLSVVSPVASGERGSDLSLGWGLRGIRERVELTHGTFAAGPSHDGRWLLVVSLPVASESPRPATRPSTGRLVGALQISRG